MLLMEYMIISNFQRDLERFNMRYRSEWLGTTDDLVINFG